MSGILAIQKASGGVLNVTSTDGATSTNLVLPLSGTVASTDGATVDNTVPRYDGVSGKLQGSGVVIDDSGNIGIGTSMPSSIAKLTVSNASSTDNNKIGLVASDFFSLSSYSGTFLSHGDIGATGTSCGIPNTRLGQLYFQNVSNALIWTNSGVPIIFGNAALERMRIDSAGNVLVTGSGGLGYGTGSGGAVTQLTSKSTAVTLNKPTGQITMNGAALAAGARVQFPVNNSLVSSSDNILVSQAGYYPVDTANYRYEVTAQSTGSFLISVTNMSGISLSEQPVIQFTVIKGAKA